MMVESPKETKMENKKFTIGQSVKLKFSSDDYYDEDLGFSGIVLKGPAKEYDWALKHDLYYAGTLSINKDWCLLESINSDKEIIKEFTIHKSFFYDKI